LSSGKKGWKNNSEALHMKFIDILITSILAFIMLSVGLSLSWKQFVVTFTRPRAFAVGLILQMVFLPVLAFLVVAFSGLPVEYKLGILILAACPGGMTSTFITYLLNANTALAISLTVINSFIALLSVPIIVNLGLQIFMHTGADLSLPFWPTVQQIFLITILPVFVGVLFRRLNPEFAVKTENSLKWVTVALLGILFAIKFFATEAQGGTGITVGEVAVILPFSVIVNVISLFSGYFAGRWFDLGPDDQLTMGINVGIQNTSFAFLIAGTLLGNEEMNKPALVYAMFTFFTAVFYGLWIKPGEIAPLKRRLKKRLNGDFRE
jgi:bile acid:Na+ symporter, BASS family